MLKVVLTGGPCAGKTEILSKLTQTLEERGYKVITVFETATALMLNGIHPCKEIPIESFQEIVFKMQMENENLFEKTANFYDPKKVIIFYDRGIMDSCAYIDKDTTFRNRECYQRRRQRNT